MRKKNKNAIAELFNVELKFTCEKLEKLENILKEACPVYENDLEGLVSEINSVEIKNNNSKLPKFTTKMYAFFYDCLMDFPACKFNELKTITTKGMFENF